MISHSSTTLPNLVPIVCKIEKDKHWLDSRLPIFGNPFKFENMTIPIYNVPNYSDDVDNSLVEELTEMEKENHKRG